MEDKKALSDEELEGVSGGNTEYVKQRGGRGFGMLTDDSGGKDAMVFVCNNPGLKLNEGQHASYDATRIDTGDAATNVKVI